MVSARVFGHARPHALAAVGGVFTTASALHDNTLNHRRRCLAVGDEHPTARTPARRQQLPSRGLGEQWSRGNVPAPVVQ